MNRRIALLNTSIALPGQTNINDNAEATSSKKITLSKFPYISYILVHT